MQCSEKVVIIVRCGVVLPVVHLITDGSLIHIFVLFSFLSQNCVFLLSDDNFLYLQIHNVFMMFLFSVS